MNRNKQASKANAEIARGTPFSGVTVSPYIDFYSLALRRQKIESSPGKSETVLSSKSEVSSHCFFFNEYEDDVKEMLI